VTAPDCHADRDGDCNWDGCPQNRDGEPVVSGRHCPLDVTRDDWDDPDPADVARRDAHLAAEPWRQRLVEALGGRPETPWIVAVVLPVVTAAEEAGYERGHRDCPPGQRS
jgi:hypothetical protein